MLFVTVLEVRTQSKIGLWWFFLVVCLPSSLGYQQLFLA
jgi:hypothetical protein